MTELANVSWAEPGDAAAVAARVASEVARKGPKRIAVPGGKTPERVFALLAEMRLDWLGTTLVVTDDRQVPDDHPASNFGKLVDALGESGAVLVGLAEGDRPAPFDLVWLGMGADGHVASLFPGMKAMDDAKPCVIATVPNPLPPEAPFARLSLNLASLVAAREIIVAVTGTDKRGVLESAFEAPSDLPIARLLRAARCPVTIYWSET